MKPRLLYVVNEAAFFLSHRLPLALAARDAGYEVHVATPLSAAVADIQGHGLYYHPIPLGRRSLNPWREVSSLVGLWRLYRRLRPTLVHHVTIKPVIYGGLAARLAGVPAVVSAVTGLGYVFIGSDWKARLLRRLVGPAYRLALAHGNGRVIFQNPDDQRVLIGSGACSEAQSCLIKGAGVDMEQFRPGDRQDAGSVPVVLLASRMLWDKGVGEFVAAARHLRQSGHAAHFVLAGATDAGNPAAIDESQLLDWQAEGAVAWLGQRDDMADLLRQADIVCLPSYREGLPRVLIEAAACGRAIVATDVPGCREVVCHGENGLLVPVRDARALAEALGRLLDDPASCRRMGALGRKLVEEECSMESVIAATLALYRESLQRVSA